MKAKRKPTTIHLNQEGLRVLRERKKEPSRRYEEFLKDLKRDGLI